MTKFRKLAMAAALSGAAAFSLGTGAMAATVSVNADSNNGVGGTVISAAVPSGSAPTTAGAFSMTSNESSGSLVGSFVAFCVDLAHTITIPGSNYTYDIGASPFGATIAAAVQKLFDANYASVDTSNANQAAAFQIALWKTLYDDVTFTYNNAGTGATVDSLVAGYLSAADTYSDGKQWNLTWLNDGKKSDGETAIQGLVTVAPVPVPAAGFLLMGGLAGLGVMARRRKAAAA